LPRKLGFAWQDLENVPILGIALQPACRNGAYGAENHLFHLLFTLRNRIFHDALLHRLRISSSLTASNFAQCPIEEGQDEFD
jgi:hypothetical protein